jgi:hypothetical protein
MTRPIQIFALFFFQFAQRTASKRGMADSESRTMRKRVAFELSTPDEKTPRTKSSAKRRASKENTENKDFSVQLSMEGSYICSFVRLLTEILEAMLKMHTELEETKALLAKQEKQNKSLKRKLTVKCDEVAELEEKVSQLEEVQAQVHEIREQLHRFRQSFPDLCSNVLFACALNKRLTLVANERDAALSTAGFSTFHASRVRADSCRAASTCNRAARDCAARFAHGAWSACMREASATARTQRREAVRRTSSARSTNIEQRHTRHNRQTEAEFLLLVCACNQNERTISRPIHSQHRNSRTLRNSERDSVCAMACMAHSTNAHMKKTNQQTSNNHRELNPTRFELKRTRCFTAASSCVCWSALTCARALAW